MKPRDAGDTAGVEDPRTPLTPRLCGVALVLLILSAAGCSGRPAPSSVYRSSTGVGVSPTTPRRTTPPKPPSSAQTTKPYQVMGRWYHPLAHASGFTESGYASWYGKKFHGRKTANGETYDMYGLSAAHKTLPLGTYVRVHNHDNGRTLDVRINDRGPFVQGRIIDLSYGAAKQLGVIGPGTARVTITALGTRVASATGPDKQATYRPVDYDKGNFTFQVGAFKNQGNALRLVAKLNKQFQNAHVTPYYHEVHGMLYGVRVGRATTLEQAAEFKAALRQKGFKGAFTIAE